MITSSTSAGSRSLRSTRALERLGGQVGRVPARQLAVALAAGGADGVDDDGGGHVLSPCRIVDPDRSNLTVRSRVWSAGAARVKARRRAGRPTPDAEVRDRRHPGYGSLPPEVRRAPHDDRGGHHVDADPTGRSTGWSKDGRSPAEFLTTVAAHADQDGPAVDDRRRTVGRVVTFAEMADRVARAAAGLRALGVGARRPGRADDAQHPRVPLARPGGAVPAAPRRSRIYNSSSPEQVAYLAGHCGAQGRRSSRTRASSSGS